MIFSAISKYISRLRPHGSISFDKLYNLSLALVSHFNKHVQTYWYNRSISSANNNLLFTIEASKSDSIKRICWQKKKSRFKKWVIQIENAIDTNSIWGKFSLKFMKQRASLSKRRMTDNSFMNNLA